MTLNIRLRPVVSDWYQGNRCFCLEEGESTSHSRSLEILAHRIKMELKLGFDDIDFGYDLVNNPNGFGGHGTLPDPQKNISNDDYRYLCPKEIQILRNLLELSCGTDPK